MCNLNGISQKSPISRRRDEEEERLRVGKMESVSDSGNHSAKIHPGMGFGGLWGQPLKIEYSPTRNTLRSAKQTTREREH